MVLALCWGGCSSLPLTHQAWMDSQGQPYLTFTATPHTCFQTCTVTLKAEIHGPIQWCPTALHWDFGDGSHDEPVGACTQRIFSQVRTYRPGNWGPTVQIFSDGSAVANPLATHVSVVIPSN